MRVLIFSKTSVRSTFRCKKELRERRSKQHISRHVQYSSCHIIMKLKFSRRTFEKYSNFITIRPEETELFHAI
jgi:hypothetical protein